MALIMKGLWSGIDCQGGVGHVGNISAGLVVFVPVRVSMQTTTSFLHMAINIAIITVAERFLGIKSSPVPLEISPRPLDLPPLIIEFWLKPLHKAGFVSWRSCK